MHVGTGHQAAAGQRLDEGVQGKLFGLLPVLCLDGFQFPLQFRAFRFGRIAQKVGCRGLAAGLPLGLELLADLVDLDEFGNRQRCVGRIGLLVHQTPFPQGHGSIPQ